MKKLPILKRLLALCIPLMFLTACEKSNDEASQLNLSDVREEIIICAIYDETAGSATIKAENRFNNSSEMGLCWSETSDNPTTSDIKKQVSKPAKKVFIERLDYLNPETTYYVRAYVIQKNITQYSPVMFFKTLREPIKIVPER